LSCKYRNVDIFNDDGDDDGNAFFRDDDLDDDEMFSFDDDDSDDYIRMQWLGVIEAKIDHENGWLTSHEVLDIYGSEEPQRAFHK